MIKYQAIIRKLPIGYELEVTFPDIGYKCGLITENQDQQTKMLLVNKLKRTICLMDQLGQFNYEAHANLGEYINPKYLRIHSRYRTFKPIYKEK